MGGVGRGESGRMTAERFARPRENSKFNYERSREAEGRRCGRLNIVICKILNSIALRYAYTEHADF